MIARLRAWWRRHHPRPYDWATEVPELCGPDQRHVRRVWPDPEPGPEPAPVTYTAAEWAILGREDIASGNVWGE